MAKKTGLKLLSLFLLILFFGNTQLSFANNNSENPADTNSGAKITVTVNDNPKTGSKEPETPTTKPEIELETPGTEKPGVIDKSIQDLKKINIKRTANKTFYYSSGAVSATISLASFVGLYFLFKKLDEMKKSYIKNFIFKLSKKLILYFNNQSQYDEYMIPAAIAGLAANGIITLVMAIRMFRAGYKA